MFLFLKTPIPVDFGAHYANEKQATLFSSGKINWLTILLYQVSRVQNLNSANKNYV